MSSSLNEKYIGSEEFEDDKELICKLEKKKAAEKKKKIKQEERKQIVDMVNLEIWEYEKELARKSRVKPVHPNQEEETKKRMKKKERTLFNTLYNNVKKRLNEDINPNHEKVKVSEICRYEPVMEEEGPKPLKHLPQQTWSGYSLASTSKSKHLIAETPYKCYMNKIRQSEKPQEYLHNSPQVSYIAKLMLKT